MRLVGRALRRILRGVVIAVLEAAAIAREVVLIPIRLWMSAAEAAGRLVLGAWRLTWPVLERIWRAAAAAGRTAARLVTPARAVAVVVVAAALSLGASQLVHYRGVEVGAPPGAGITADAAVPQVDQLTPRDQHGLVILAAAVAALVITAVAIAGRWRAARGVSLVGLGTLAVALIGDAPAGLDAGRAALAYQGAHAVLLTGFWVELAAGGTLAVGGVLLAGYLRAEQSSPTLRSGRAASRLAAGGAGT